MKLVEIYVNDQEVAGEHIAQAFCEWQGQGWEMTVKAASKAKAYLQEWAVDQNAANKKYGVYMF